MEEYISNGDWVHSYEPAVYKSQVVLDNHELMCTVLDTASAHLKGLDHTVHQMRESFHFTWSYGRYNIFGVTSPTDVFYQLWEELNEIVYQYTKADRLWIQSWMNCDPDHDPLMRHHHIWPWHGYITIRPHKTRTVFDDGTQNKIGNTIFEIENEIGNVYIGPGELFHRVVVDEKYSEDTPRYTIGFDLNHERLRMSSEIGLMPYPRICLPN
tara:strand:- start:306 stop:941 length:636 start_codon:yes stop_codon:yes gene_type:complete